MIRYWHWLVAQKKEEEPEQEYYIVSGTALPRGFFDVYDEYEDSESVEFNDVVNVEQNGNS